jgi:hypothetical protein
MSTNLPFFDLRADRHTFLPVREAGQIVVNVSRAHGYKPTPDMVAHEACRRAGDSWGWRAPPP